MVAVRGSKRYQMMVVRYRPMYWAGVFAAVTLLMAVLAVLTVLFGPTEVPSPGMNLVRESKQLDEELAASISQVASMKQEIADLKLGNDVDTRTTEEVRRTVEGLEAKIASLQEEVAYYKGAMLPGTDEKGLRIEKLDLSYAGELNTVQYNLLLTQVVEKQKLIEGTVEISLNGLQGDLQRTLTLGQVSDQKKDVIGFRFRYFQKFSGELKLPAEFMPQEVLVVAKSAGKNGARVERRFEWQLGEG